ncbi:MAG: S8 family serine peptidase [Nocardioides sp.]
MFGSMQRGLVLVSASAITLALAVSAAASPAPDAQPWGQAKAQIDNGYALVQLTGAPLSTSPRTKPVKGKKINFSNSTVKSEQARLTAERNAFKSWLQKVAPKTQVTKEFDLAVNAVAVKLNGTKLDLLRTGPGVTYVEPQAIFSALAEDPDLTLVKAVEAWEAHNGPANAGLGVKVGILDTGIDISHPCFDDTGYPATTQLGDKRYTNNKVIVARIYGNTLKKVGEDNADINGHGTHVAGTVACNYQTPASLDGAAIPYAPSGVAPKAQLGAYKVLVGTGGSGRSEDILQGMQDAYKDGMDVINMSLGGSMQSGSQLTVNAVNNLDEANMVVAVAAGNEGPGYWTVHYPGAAQRGLTAGASTVGHNVVNQVTAGGADYDMTVGEFAPLTADLTASLAVVEDPATAEVHKLSEACNGMALPDLTGKIGVIGRGTCTFGEKMTNVEAAGAVAMIVVNREEGLLAMANSGVTSAIPGVMVTLSTGQALKALNGQPATLHATGVYKTFPTRTHLMAGFSSQGPVPGSMLAKPDVVAPGADVLSSQPAWACSQPPCWAFFGGTSMATPHLAGIAAFVKGVHPGWSAEQIRSAVVNTSQEGLLRDPISEVVTNDAMIVGSGLADTLAAAGAKVTLSPVSLSWGSIPSGSGKAITKSVTLTNTTSATHTYKLTVGDDAADAVTFSVPAAGVTLAPGASATVQVTATSTKGGADAFYQARLGVSVDGASAAHAVLFAVIGAGVGAPGQHTDPPKVGQQ